VTASSEGPSRPPFPWRLFAQVLIRGEDAADIRQDVHESFERDLERGLGRRAAGHRYARNVLGSVLSLFVARLKGLATHGTLLDAKLGVRMLGRQPLLTGVAMLALGLGIPASLVVNHVLDVMSRPLPVPEGDRVMGIRYWEIERTAALSASVHDYAYWQETLSSFQSLGAARSYEVNVRAEDAGSPPLAGAEITASTFELMRSAPLLGRVLSEADEVRGAADVILLSEDVWLSRFAGDPAIVGKVVRVGTTQHTVVGVMPSSFRFPAGNDVWLPLRAAPTDYRVGQGPELLVYGRLAGGVASSAMRRFASL
jgi:putative ABC transport system permease protein